jgi:hypothetical protein
MSSAGQSYNIPNGGASRYGRYANDDENYYKWQEDERRRRQQGGGGSDVGGIIQQVMMGAEGASRLGSGFGPTRGDSNGGGAPHMSGFGALNNSRPGGPGTPRYHEEIPMGGTPGVYAIRNDEIFGPRRDRFGRGADNPFGRHTYSQRNRRR